MEPRTLVLWEVDHTLMETGGVGAELFRDAFEQVTGRKLEHAADVTGRTEPAIFLQTLQLHGIPGTKELLDRYADLLAAGYRARASVLRARGRSLPGAQAAIAALERIGAVVQSVLTGNLRRVAETKLQVFGLDAGLDLDVGAYGADDLVRARLVLIARRRAAEKYEVPFSSGSTILIGDTAGDVAAARDGGAQVIAVASGRSTAAELRQAGARLVLASLQELDVLVEAILDEPPHA